MILCVHGIAWALAVAGALYGLHRLALWLEDRGWLYYVNHSRRGRASLAIAAAIDPAARLVLELQEAEVDEDVDPDEPPKPTVSSLSGEPKS